MSDSGKPSIAFVIQGIRLCTLVTVAIRFHEARVHVIVVDNGQFEAVRAHDGIGGQLSGEAADRQ